MAMHVYSTTGEPVGFVMETFIYDLRGLPLGRIIGSRVHRFDGSYVGEFFKDMVVAKPDGRPRALLPMAPPPRRVPPSAGFNRRVVLHNGYADAFHLLSAPQPEDWSVAAE